MAHARWVGEGILSATAERYARYEEAPSMSPIPSLPSREDVLRMARSTTDITGQLLDTAGNITRIAVNTFDPRDGAGAEALRVLRETTAELAEASASPQAQEAFYRIVDTLTRLGTSGAPLAAHPVSEPAQLLLAALGDSLLPVLDAVAPAVEEAADALSELVDAGSPLLPAAAGITAGVLLALTPVIRAAAHVLRDTSPELRRIADALTAALAPLLPLQVALAERAAAVGAGVVRASLPPWPTSRRPPRPRRRRPTPPHRHRGVPRLRPGTPPTAPPRHGFTGRASGPLGGGTGVGGGVACGGAGGGGGGGAGVNRLCVKVLELPPPDHRSFAPIDPVHGAEGNCLRGAGTVEEAKQHRGLRAEARGAVGVRGRSQLRRKLQSLGGLGTHDVHDTSLAQLTPRRLRDADTNRRLLKGQAAELSFVHGHGLSVFHRGKCCAQGAHRVLVAGAHRFRQCLTHTKTHRHVGDLMAAPLDPTTRYTCGTGPTAD